MLDVGECFCITAGRFGVAVSRYAWGPRGRLRIQSTDQLIEGTQGSLFILTEVK